MRPPSAWSLAFSFDHSPMIIGQIEAHKFVAILVLAAMKLAHLIGTTAKYVHFAVEHTCGVEIAMLRGFALKLSNEINIFI